MRDQQLDILQLKPPHPPTASLAEPSTLAGPSCQTFIAPCWDNPSDLQTSPLPITGGASSTIPNESLAADAGLGRVDNAGSSRFDSSPKAVPGLGHQAASTASIAFSISFWSFARAAG